MSLFDSEADVERGRRLVESDARLDGMADNLRMIAYRQQMRQRAAWHGCCGRNEHVERRGRMVCKHTLQPCGRVELAELVELWSAVNGVASSRKARDK